MNTEDIEKLTRIETTVGDLKHFLMGNGQPGVIELHNRRLTKLENWRWWVLGIATALGVVLGASGQRIIAAIKP